MILEGRIIRNAMRNYRTYHNLPDDHSEMLEFEHLIGLPPTPPPRKYDHNWYQYYIDGSDQWNLPDDIAHRITLIASEHYPTLIKAMEAVK